jgi:MFS family permease
VQCPIGDCRAGPRRGITTAETDRIAGSSRRERADVSELVGTTPVTTAPGKTAATAAPRPGARPGAGPRASVESRGSWVAAGLTLAMLSVSYGSPLLAVVGLKPITEDLATDRQLVALVSSLTWFGTGLGGIVMGQVAERIGIRASAMFGATMIALGLAVSASGNLWAMLVGHAVLVGFLGNGALYPPLIVYVSRWFDRRRGTALALISSGQYIAGMGWPALFEYGMRSPDTALRLGGHTLVLHGWQITMLAFACLVVIAVPIIAAFLKPAPEVAEFGEFAREGRRGDVMGLRPNTVLALICTAGFLCCVPMSIPQGHLVAFCSDLGLPAIQGAMMLSVLQASAFVSRVLWGWMADRIGGLKTVLLGSSLQAVAVAAFMTTQDEAGLFAIAAAYGFGFSGIIPAYVVAIRELFPSREASWRVPSVLFVSMGGMAFGGWWAGALYDHFGFYGPAFLSGVLFNLANIAVVAFLVLRQRRFGGFRPALA